MKPAAVALACVLGLSACDNSSKVELHNATGNEVAEAVKRSGPGAGDEKFRPGLWRSKVTVQEMNMPGMPAQLAERMKHRLAQQQQMTAEHCLTPEDARSPKESFFTNGDKSCRYDHFSLGEGKIDMQMECDRQGTTQTTTMKGSYTPTSYSMDMASHASGGQSQAMSMKMHVDSNRVGDCKAKG